MLAQASSAQLASLIFEYESAGGRQLRYEIVAAQAEAEGLMAHRLGGLEIVNQFEPIGRPRQGREGRAVGRHLDWLADNQRSQRLFLLDDTGLFNGIDKPPAAAIAARDLADLSASDLYNGIADAHSRQCRQAVFDRFDEQGAVT